MRASTSCTSSPRSEAATPSSGSSSACAPSLNSACARNGHADWTSSNFAPPPVASSGTTAGIEPSTRRSSSGRPAKTAAAGAGALHLSGSSPRGMPASSALGRSGASPANCGTLRITSSALRHSRASSRRAPVASISAVAPGRPCRCCHSRGRNGSGEAGAGHRAVSSPQTQSASKLMPAQVSGSMIVSEARSSCGSNSTPSAWSRSNATASVAASIPVQSSFAPSSASSLSQRWRAWCSSPSSPSPGQPMATSNWNQSCDQRLGRARRGQARAAARPDPSERSSPGHCCFPASRLRPSRPRSGPSFRRT